MPTLRTFARTIRHAPGLNQLDFLWSALRTPYYALAKRRGGVTLTLGGYPVRVPVEYADQGWESYEAPAMRAFTEWLSDHPDGLVVDVGCAVGLYAHVALSIAPSTRVVAIDADVPSLAATKRLTAAVSGDRLTLIGGFVSDASTGEDRYGEAVLATIASLNDRSAGTPTYQFLGKNNAVPTYTLDGLFAARSTHRPALIKMDIEGAELYALRGAKQLLVRKSVTLLVSVHPVHLARDFNSSANAVRELLTAAGYRITLLGIDHEEHWLCQR